MKWIMTLIAAALFGVWFSSWEAFIAILLLVGITIWLTQSKSEQSESDAKHESDISRSNGKRQKFVPQYVLLQRLERLEQELAQTQARLAQLESRLPEYHAQTAADISASAQPQADFRQPETFAAATVPSAAVAVPISAPETPWHEIPQATATDTADIATNTNHDNSTFKQPETPIAAEQKTVSLKKTGRPRKEKEAKHDWKDHVLWAWFMRANPLLKVGALVLFLGLAFLLRYVGGAIPLEGRYLLVFATGTAAVIGGARLRAYKREYGLTLQGFGFGVMYLTVLAAVKLHPLLPNGVAFTAMVALVGLMALHAVRHDAKIMAQAAVLGGLAAPVLTSDGSGSYLILFTYLALLNGGIALLAWFKTWRSLNLMGMLGTFWIAATWGAREYTPQLLAVIEPFLLYHWLLYTAIACFFARKTLQQEPLSGSLKNIPDNAPLERIWQTVLAYGSHIGALDSSLLFGSALLAFGLQYEMVETFHYGAAWSALGWAAVYGALAVYFARLSDDFAVMKQAFAVLAWVFATLAIPLALEQEWTAMAWALEAALIYVFGLSQRQPQMRVLAIAVFLLAAMVHFSTLSLGDETLLHGSLTGTVLATASGMAIYFAWAAWRRQGSAQWEQFAAVTVLLLALVHAMTLPMILFGQLGCTVAFAVYALAFAAAQLRQPQAVFSGFALLSVLMSLFFGWSWDFGAINHKYVYLVTAAVLWLGTALLLHLARWQPEYKDSATAKFNHFGGWLALVAAVCFGHATLIEYWSFSTATSDTAWLQSWLVWHGGLLLLAHFSGWRQGVQAATVLAMWFALSAAWWRTPIWATFIPWQAFGFMLAVTVLAALGLFWQPEKASQDKSTSQWTTITHTATLLLYVLMWMRFSGSTAELHTAAIAPWGWLWLPLLVWLVLTQIQARLTAAYRRAYWHIGSPAMAMLAMMWLVYSNFAAPPRSALPYLPLLNVVEMGSLAVLWQLYRWLGIWQPENSENNGQYTLHRWFSGCLPALLLLLISSSVMRLWHVFANVPWHLRDLLASFGVQASLSIVWALVAIALMVSGNRNRRRLRWLVGASIMGVVVLKLFLIELGNSGGVARIVSFIVVGLLMLLVGWFAPAPPKEEKEE